MQKNNMSVTERKFLKAILGEQPPLDYPLKPLTLSNGFTSQVYEIPKKEKPGVYEKLYCFTDGMSMDDEALDIHSGKMFHVRDFLVIREDGMNFLASPYYPESGGTVLDWAMKTLPAPITITAKWVKTKK